MKSKEESTKESKTIRYTETIERSFRLTVGEKDATKVIKGLRNKSLTYVYNDEDRSKGAIVGLGETVSLTTEDYGLVMRRENFRAEVEWPDTGILAWFWDNERIHSWFTRGLLVIGWAFVFCMMLLGKSEYAGTRWVLLVMIMTVPLLVQTLVLSFIHLKRDGLGA